jgi:hypothetical protein
MKRLIFFRKTSVFSAIFCTLFLLTVLSTSASAGQIYATSYDLYNGGIGGYGNAYFYDDKYTGSGSKTTPYAWLSGGLGDLTDGIVATLNWSDGTIGNLSQNVPYVGWNNGDSPYATFTHNPPSVTFHFAPNTNIDEVKLYSNNGYRPDPVDFLMTGGAVTQPLTRTVGGDNTGPANKMYDFTALGLIGDTLTMTFHYHPAPYAADWILISEVEFFAPDVIPPNPSVPEPATMLLLGSGLIGLAGYGRKKFLKK